MRPSGNDYDPKAPVNWQVVKTMTPYLLEYRGRILLAILCLVGAKVASVGLPFILKYIVDDLQGQLTAQSLAVAVPLALLVAYGAARLSNVLLGEVRDTLFGRVTERAMRRVGLKVFEHLHHLDLAFHLDRRTGGMARDIERGTSGISFLMRFMVFNIVPTFLELFFVMLILWRQYNIYFAVIVLISVVAYVWYSMRATDWRTEYIREANMADSRTNTRAVDSLLNFETVKYFANEEYEARMYDKELAVWENARRKNRLSLFALNTGQALIIALAMTAMLILAAYEVADKRMTIGDFVLINAFMMQIFMPLNFLGFVYREIKGSLANIERLFGLLEVKASVTDIADAPALEVKEGALEFINVSFHYAPERPILKNLNLAIKAGQKVALVGASGAGKSTIGKLLFRFYDVTAGAIKIDGQDIRQISQHSLRSAVGVVPQDTVLFNTSLIENVRYGRPDASDEEVKKAISLAHLDKFIASLPKGYDTQVGERGLKLSGGEKQRVAIARTVLKNPAILLFDEATSSLDSESEKAILDAINEVAKGRTSIVIAHRLSTIIDADVIFVLEQGELVEAGNHAALIAKNARYAQLWRLQQEQREQHNA